MKVFALAALCSGCGKYAKPIPPEVLAPKTVNSLAITADNSGVNFQWDASLADRRGKELRTMNGYYIYRKELKARTDAVDPSVKFELIDSVPDTHIDALKEKRLEYKEKGIPQHRATVPKELTHFQYSDKSVQPGHTYLYKIVPFNQGDVEGEARQGVRVVFTGESSQIDLKELAQDDEEQL